MQPLVAENTVEQAGIDIIGDIHGCHKALQCLLKRLGYAEQDGIYRHPTHTAVFVGDLIDRGPEIRETLELVYRMEQAGSARLVLGNHEYNAIRYRTALSQYLTSDKPGRDQLPERLFRLMKETLEQFQDYPEQWQIYTDWFSRLPLIIEGNGYRVVHACWDSELIKTYKERYDSRAVNDEFIEASKQQGSFESRLVDRLTRGTSLPLPKGVQLQSKDGFIRRFFRTKFWADSPMTYGDVVFQPDPLPYDLAEHPIDHHHRTDLVHYALDEVPVFFGHYWLKGRPQPLQVNVACLDYSAVGFGRLTAYRFSGESALTSDHFTWVTVDPA